jgi:hypothetical protein
MKIGPDQIAESQTQNDASCGIAISRRQIAEKAENKK